MLDSKSDYWLKNYLNPNSYSTEFSRFPIQLGKPAELSRVFYWKHKCCLPLPHPFLEMGRNMFITHKNQKKYCNRLFVQWVYNFLYQAIQNILRCPGKLWTPWMHGQKQKKEKRLSSFKRKSESKGLISTKRYTFSPKWHIYFYSLYPLAQQLLYIRLLKNACIH